MVLLFFVPHSYHSSSKCPRLSQSLCILLLLLLLLPSSIIAGAKVPCDSSYIGLPSSSSSSGPQAHHSYSLQESRDDPGVGISPPVLEWGDKPLFQAATLTLTISNECNSTELTIMAPWSTNSQFYVSGFKQVSPEAGVSLQPGGHLQLRVVFLPRVVGAMQGVLLIHTSSGSFLVQLQGRGTPSPFNLRPLRRIRLAPGETQREAIFLRNPFPEAMSVREVRVWPANSHNRTLLLTNHLNDEVGVTTRCCDSSPQQESLYEVSLQPGGSWEAGPGESLRVVELEVTGGSGSWSGVVYVLLSCSSGGASKQLVLPVSVEVGEESRRKPGGELQAVPEVVDFGLLSGRKVVRRQGVFLFNAGSEAAEIERVSHSSGGRRDLVAVRYRAGLVITPGRHVQVALAWYRGGVEHSSSVCPHHHSDTELDSLVVHTNVSGAELLRVPYQALVSRSSDEESYSQEEEELITHVASGLQLPLSQFEELERKLFQAGGVFLSSGEFEVVEDVVALRAPEQPLSQESSLVFAAVEVGSVGSLWVSLTNPGDTPISVQLLVSARVKASGCEESSEEGAVFYLGESGVSEGVLGASQTLELGPVLFRPVRRCSWRGLLAVKNNFSSVEWIPLQGSGSLAELSFVEDSPLGLPLEWLQLSGSVEAVSTISVGVDENLSRISSQGLNCKRRINGSLVAKNTGDAPLKVHSVRLVNGRCSWQGLELPSCPDNLWLAAGESAQLRVSYTPDFGAAKVRQDLRLVTSIGTVHFPVLVVLPDHMLRLCATIPFYFKYKKVLLLLGLLALLFFLLFFQPKLNHTHTSPDDDDASATSSTSLPFFREDAFASQESSNLSKIRVNVRPDSLARAPLTDLKPQQQHSIAVSSPASSPRKPNGDRSKRKKKKAQGGPVCSVKVQDRSSSCSSPSSSAPASPPITPVRCPVPPASTLDVETGAATPLRASSSAERLAENEAGDSSGEWVTVDRKSAMVDRAGKVRAGLTHSASFPSSRGDKAPTDRAPGSKLSKNSSSSSLANEQDSFSERSNSGRFSPGNVIVEQADCHSSSLVYDIWGDHFAEISRQSKKMMSSCVGDGADSLFAYSLLKQQQQQQQQQQQLSLQQQQYYYHNEQASNFSMFSGNAAAVFMREADQEEVQQQQDLSPAHFLVSPFDLSYRFPSA